jgi:carboxyl-terminal processing protease
MTKRILVPTVTIVLILAISILSGVDRLNLFASTKDFYAKIKVFTSMLETINRAYLYERDPEELLESAVKGVITSLDPHTVYLPAGDFNDWNQSFEGYVGIGISFDRIGDHITLMSVLKGGPAEKAGLLPGDRLLSIDGQEITGLKKELVGNQLLGPSGLPVIVGIARDGWTNPRDFQLIRRRIQLNSLQEVMLLDNGIGFIKMDKFTGSTARELDNALRQLKDQGMKGLILDLRGNGGGYLHAAVDVADKFLPEGHRIVTTRGRLASSFHEYYSTAPGTEELYPLIVLIDHGSASAAEIVAGAIQDLDRGLIVGKSSFGKGLVQSQYRFHDGSALLITTAKYFTPSGRPIQRDFFDKTKEEYYRDAYVERGNRDQNAHFDYETDYRTLAGRTVYAGGGITPDIWVENDENILSEELRALLFSESRIFYSFIEEYLKKHPNLKKIRKDRFVTSFAVTDEIFREFCVFVKKFMPEFGTGAFHENRQDINFLLKREMAYLIGGAEWRFWTNSTRDRQLEIAMRQFQKARDLITMAKFVN